MDHVSKCCMRAEIPDVQELPMGLFWNFRSVRENKIWSSKATALWTLVSCPWGGFGAPAFRHLQLGFATYFTCISMGKGGN